MSFEYNIDASGVATATADAPTGFSSFLTPAMDILSGSAAKGASYDLVRRGAMVLLGATVVVTSVATRARITNAVQAGQPIPPAFLKYIG